VLASLTPLFHGLDSPSGVASASAGDASNPSCTDAQGRARVALSALLGKEVSENALMDILGTGAKSAVKGALSRFPNAQAKLVRVLAGAGSGLRRQGLKVLGKTIVKQLGRVSELGWFLNVPASYKVWTWGIGASYNVALHCLGARVILIPTHAKRKSGEPQLYNLLVLDRHGKDIGAAPPDAMTIDDGACTPGTPDWSCYGLTVGRHPVSATFGYFPRASGTLEVTEPLTIVTSSLRGGIPGVQYNVTLEATGGDGALIWESVAPLPQGFSLSSSGIISGTPQSLAEGQITVSVHDGYGDTAQRTYSLTIAPPPCSGNPCAIADGNGEVTVAWQACPCSVSEPNFHGFSGDYYFERYINEVAPGYLNGPLPFFQGQGGRLWYTSPFETVGSMVAYRVYFGCWFGPTEEFAESPAVQPLGSEFTNTVNVK
jgi:Putative Ig domain